jgi:acyl-coenzyme A synthetase/AMP-(fatty) acid ligase
LGVGYLNRPALTEQRFIVDPFSNYPGAKMYKTGDMGRWLPDGNIEYLGRIDDQVKIRGYRIELGEIETILQQSEWVSQAVVLARENRDGNKYLVGYIVPENEFNKDAITGYLKSSMPDHMVPGIIDTAGLFAINF